MEKILTGFDMDNLEPVATPIGDKDFLSPYYKVLDDAEPVKDQELYPAIRALNNAQLEQLTALRVRDIQRICARSYVT
ncbi:hypothetical protein N7471_008664 [Penicillium samsonianum]|uniref:uncharacterized protein n=1 Tax=Penicillium samsonianum TaxID=1882272 RepID=UPI002548897A|nr:uncharacterized protein N7471_008664 [Penicillium samsonianum]KAJ6133449.1 hypothetical protein N7471_008664 [Penicillium samsonianum]